MPVMRTAILTGGSRGLGLALTQALSADGWRVVCDARDGKSLAAATEELAGVIALAGDVTDGAHRQALVAAAGPTIDLVVNSAGTLGAAPLPAVANYPLDALTAAFAVNVVAPLALIQLALPHMPDGATLINVSSDAATGAYPGWGGYGATKAALDQLTNVHAAEDPALNIYALDPGDMRTQMHQDACPGEDIGDRPRPQDVAVPAILTLLDAAPPSGRYRAEDIVAIGATR